MDQPYEMESSRLRIRGRHNGREIKMGDTLEVQIVKTDLQRRRIDMALATDGEVADFVSVGRKTKQHSRPKSGKRKERRGGRKR
jgi:transcriptional accessory protein Tex/SPT6